MNWCKNDKVKFHYLCKNDKVKFQYL